MKKKGILLVIIFCMFISGCKKDNKKECSLNIEDNETMKSYTTITLKEKNNIVVEEELYVEYVFNSKEDAENNYKVIEQVLEKDKSIKIEQKEKKIIGHGTKDLKDMKYDLKSKVSYYEQLGYTCK